MDKRKLNWITMAFVILTVLVVGLMLNNTLRRSSHITLPEAAPQSGELPGEAAGDGSLTVVEITPKTVQSAIETLDRPECYRRTILVEQIWSGGSGTIETLASVRDGWTRTDRTLVDGQRRHTLTDGETTYIWYNEEKTAAAVSAGGITADNDQQIPTYEDVLKLPVETITEADFREISGLHCIYVETAPDEGGYCLRYWVSVDTGLLVAAERLLEDEPIYRMTSLSVEEAEPPAEDFLLPDGKAPN